MTMKRVCEAPEEFCELMAILFPSRIKQITVPRPTRAYVCARSRPPRPRPRWTPRTSPRRWSPGTGRTPSSWAPLCSPERPRSRPGRIK